MNAMEARAVVVAALQQIAPEVELGSVSPTARLRDEVDIDSLDLLELVSILHESTGVDIPESDYDEIDTLDSLIGYLVAHAAA